MIEDMNIQFDGSKESKRKLYQDFLSYCFSEKNSKTGEVDVIANFGLFFCKMFDTMLLNCYEINIATVEDYKSNLRRFLAEIEYNLCHDLEKKLREIKIGIQAYNRYKNQEAISKGKEK